MGSHTPGPWRKEILWIMDRDSWDGSRIAMVDNREEAEANAHLIAAAPDMLDALTHVMDAYDTALRENRGVTIKGEWFDCIRGIIAKATSTVSEAPR